MVEVAATHPGIKWFIVDDSTISSIVIAGAATLEALSGDLRAPGYPAGFANPRTEVRAFLERSGVQAAFGDGVLFNTLRSRRTGRRSGKASASASGFLGS